MYATTLTTWQIETAARWWADRVCAPIFDGLSDEERQSGENAAYELSEILAAIAVVPVGNEAREGFTEALAGILASDVYRPGDGLRVDYGPCIHLSAAADVAGIPASNFPWKTNLYFFDDGSIGTAMGYAAPMQTISPPVQGQ